MTGQKERALQESSTEYMTPSGGWYLSEVFESEVLCWSRAMIEDDLVGGLAFLLPLFVVGGRGESKGSLP